MSKEEPTLTEADFRKMHEELVTVPIKPVVLDACYKILSARTKILQALEENPKLRTLVQDINEEKCRLGSVVIPKLNAKLDEFAKALSKTHTENEEDRLTIEAIKAETIFDKNIIADLTKYIDKLKAEIEQLKKSKQILQQLLKPQEMKP